MTVREHLRSLLVIILLAAAAILLVWNVPLVAPIIMVGAIVALVLITERRVQGAKLTGYLTGRQEMIRSIDEAHRRGLTLGEWMTAEMERDMGVYASHMLRTRRARQKFFDDVREAQERQQGEP